MDKKVLYGIIGGVLSIIIFTAIFIITKSSNKNLILTIDKVFHAYSSFVIDLGHSPFYIRELMSDTKRDPKWKGPYISKSTIEDYKDGSIEIIRASNIPTKKCTIDYMTNCYTWIKIDGLTSSKYNKIKAYINPKAETFFAQDNLFFRLSVVE